MDNNLFPHQREGVDWLIAHKGCGLLAWSPGTGKTLTSLTAIRELDGFPLLIVAPVSLLSTWAIETERWLGIAPLIIRGTAHKRTQIYESLAASPRPICLIGYETFRADQKRIFAIPWTSCIADESGKIRTPTAKVSKALRQFQPRYRIALDGTPVSNSLADLWSPIEWIAPGALYGSWYRFRAMHAIMNQWIQGKIDGWRDQDWIMRTCNKHISWKKKEDVLDLPPILEQSIAVELNPDERSHYTKIKKELLVEIEGKILPIDNILTLMLRLRQAANGVLTPHSSKLKTLQELVESLPAGEKLIVFTQFESVVSLLRSSLPYTHAYIQGSLSSEEREVEIKRFMDDPDTRLLYMTSAGERGINLQNCAYMANYDLPWSYASYEQRIGRIWRQGQTRPMTVWNLVARGTVDEHMQKILERKIALATELSRQDIEEMLK